MPYKSKAQSRFMHSQHPEIAKRWDKEYPDQKALPEKLKKKKLTPALEAGYTKGFGKKK